MCKSYDTIEMISGTFCLVVFTLRIKGKILCVVHTSGAEKADVHFQLQCQRSALYNKKVKVKV